jgi:hypothetical protein
MTLQEDIQRISCLFLLIKLCVRGWPPLVQQSVVTQCDADRSMGPALALAFLCRCLWPPAHCRHSRHPSHCPCNVQHPCIHAWPIAPVRGGVAWRQTPGQDTGHSRQLFALLRREANQNKPALLPTKKNPNPLRPTSTPQSIVISPMAPALACCNVEDGRTEGTLETSSVDL